MTLSCRHIIYVPCNRFQVTNSENIIHNWFSRFHFVYKRFLEWFSSALSEILLVRLFELCVLSWTGVEKKKGKSHVYCVIIIIVDTCSLIEKMCLTEVVR